MEVWITLGVSIAAVIIAVVAAVYAKWSADHAKRSADATDEAVSLARDEVAMTRTEHEEFLRELRARAQFELKIRTIPEAGPDDVIRVDASAISLRVGVGLKNVGERAATETVINVVMPRQYEVRWCGPNGEQPRGDAGPPADTAEIMLDATGRELPAKFLDKVRPRVPRRPHYEWFVLMQVDVPLDGSEASIPIKVTAQADELPDDVDEVVAEKMLRLARPLSADHPAAV